LTSISAYQGETLAVGSRAIVLQLQVDAEPRH
jgi:hypothetical protein